MKTRYWLIIIALIVIVFGFREGCNQKSSDEQLSEILNYKDSARYEKLKNGALISTNTSLKLNTQDQIKTLTENINDTLAQMAKKFKSLSSVTYLTNNYYAGGDTIKGQNNIPCDFKPFKVKRGDSTYTFEGTISKDYFSIDKIYIPNKISIVSGRKKVGFMRYEDAVDINNSNPLMITSNIIDYRYHPKKKIFEKTWFHLIEGALIQTGVQLGGKAIYNTYIKN